jgi:long-chain acyl-CoA synthetase
MDLLPLRAAAGGGTVDGIETSRLVAAGFTLLQRSATLVRALAGRRSAVLVPTSPQFLVGLAASDGRGAVLINPLAAPAEIAFQLEDAGVGAVFTIGSLAARLPAGTVHALLDDAPTSATVIAADGTATRVDLGSHFGLELDGDADTPGRDEECAVVYTSAMAGRPLGAILTHRNLLANARQTADAAGNVGEDHVLAALPFAHLFGLTVSGMAPLLAGARVTTMARFNPHTAVDLIERESITEVVGVPAMFAAMLGALERRGTAMRSDALRLCLCGGAPLPAELQERWADATGIELRQGYGLTEASPVALFNRVSQPNRIGMLGGPLAGVAVTVRRVDGDGELATGERGEICVRGESVFGGYVGGSADGLPVRDGWLRTGDLGIANADGTIIFAGVLKPMFTRNGFNIYPREIEAVVGAMPGVTSARAFAVPEPSRENDVGLEVRGSVTEAALKAWCETRLAAYKLPSVITIRA